MQEVEPSPIRSSVSQPYLLHCWYVAAWANELRPGGLMRRVLLDRPVLLMRSADGIVAAIGDVCPHRFASLSEGRFDGGVVECPYHGLRFNMLGRCVHNPHGDGTIPPRARVSSYPVVERYGAIWIWIGDSENADPALLPDLSFLDTAPAGQRAQGYLRTRANYQLMTDNIMDLSHADFIHRTTLGAGGEISQCRAKARVHGDVVTIEWSFDGKGMMIQRPGRNQADVHSRFEVSWYPPGVMILRSQIGPVDDRYAAISKSGAHIMTPEAAKSTHYFFESGDAEKRANFQMGMEIFEKEDGAMLEQVQRNMMDADFWDLDPVILVNDSGAVHARRALRRLIRQEAEGAAIIA